MNEKEPDERSLLRADLLLRELRPPSPAAGELLAIRRVLAEAVRGGREPEVMTLAEVAEHLRVGEAELGRIVDELPAFEFAGRLRVRRERLLEWIERRERDFTHSSAARAVGKGVA